MNTLDSLIYCEACGDVTDDPRDVPLCGPCILEFIESSFFDRMFVEGRMKPGTPSELRNKWRQTWANRQRERSQGG